MTAEQFDRVESSMVDNITSNAKTAVAAAEVEALAAAVEALANLALVRQKVQAPL